MASFALSWKSICLVSSVHPYLWLQMHEPVLDARDPPAAIFLDVLLADVPYGHRLALAICDCHTKDPLGFEDALRVMPKGPVPEVTEELLGGIEPVVNRQVVFRDTAPLAGRG